MWNMRRAALPVLIGAAALLVAAFLLSGREASFSPPSQEPSAPEVPDIPAPGGPRPSAEEREENPTGLVGKSVGVAPAGDRGRFLFLQVRGSVVDTRGKPVPGARATGSFWQDGNAIVASGLAGEAGEFFLDFVGAIPTSANPAEEIRLEIAAAGFSSTTVRDLRVPWSETFQVGALVLLRPGSIQGTVLDPGGSALPGATVSVYLLPGEAEFPDALPPKPSATARSEGSGTFRLVGIPPGVVRLAAAADGFAPTLLEPFRIRESEEVSGVALRVLAAGTIEGTTVDSEGLPVSGAEVEFSTMGPFPASPAVSDAEGRFRIGPVRIGLHGWLRASTPTAWSAELPAEGGARDLVARLVPLGRISGDVREFTPERRPCPGAAVVAFNADFEWPGFGRTLRPGDRELRASTDAEGRFEVRVPRGRKYLVRASLAGFEDGGTKVEVRDDAPEPLVGILLSPLSAGGTVRGQVVDANGQPARHALVTANPRGNIVRARSDGTFEVRNLSPGGHVLRAWAPGLLSEKGASAEVLVPAQGEAPPVLLTLRIPGGIEGSVHVRGEVPPAPFEVSAGAKTTFTDRDGRFELFPLSAGDLPIYLSARPPSRATLLQRDDLTLLGNFRGAAARATVVEGQITHVEIDAPDSLFARVHGAVLRKNEPVVGAKVQLSPDRPRFREASRLHPSRGATTGVDGTFEFWTGEWGFLEVSVYEADFPLPALTWVERIEEGGDAEIRIDLATARVEGVAVDPAGSPLPGTAVNLALSPYALPGKWTSGTVFAGPDGSFRIRGVPPGAYVLTFGKAGRATRAERLDLAPLETRNFGRVTLPLAVRIPVRVAWVDGSTLDRASLRVETEDGLPVPPPEVLNGEPGFRWSGPFPGWTRVLGSEHLARRANLLLEAGRGEVRHLGPGNWRLRLLHPAERETVLHIGDRPPESIEWNLEAGPRR